MAKDSNRLRYVSVLCLVLSVASCGDGEQARDDSEVGGGTSTAGAGQAGAAGGVAAAGAAGQAGAAGSVAAAGAAGQAGAAGSVTAAGAAGQAGANVGTVPVVPAALQQRRDACKGDAPGTPASTESSPRRYSQVTAGDTFTCGILEDTGNAVCWGKNKSGQASGVPRGVAFTALSAGSASVCGIRSDNGEVMCWGDDSAGQVSDVPDGVAFESVSAGWQHSCGIVAETGMVRCWGDDSFGQVSGAPEGVAFAVVRVGLDRTCGLRRDDGEAVCWGSSDHAAAPEGVAFVDLMVGRMHACGVPADGSKLLCWNDPYIYEDPDCRDEGPAAEAPVATPIVAVGGIDVYTCGLMADTDSVACWNAYDVPFCRVDEPRFPPKPPTDTRFASIAVGVSHACGIVADDGTLVCWPEIAGAPSDAQFASVSVGRKHTCAVQAEDCRVRCWDPLMSGWAYYEQPPLLAPDDPASLVVVGGDLSCAIWADDTVSCWGGTEGHLEGEPFGANQAFGAASASEVEARAQGFVCALPAAGGTAICKDPSYFGEEGLLPTPAGVEFTSISAGIGSVCGVRRDNAEIMCWAVPAPQGAELVELEVPSGIAFAAVSTDNNQVCGLRLGSGEAHCWGWIAEPGGVLEPPSIPLSAVSVGAHSACGIRQDNDEAVCWGTDSNLVDGVPEGATFDFLELEGDTACGILRDGRLVCWGANLYNP